MCRTENSVRTTRMNVHFLKPFPESDLYYLSLCSHAYHGPCIKCHLNQNLFCPLCRGKTTPSQLKKLFISQGAVDTVAGKMAKIIKEKEEQNKYLMEKINILENLISTQAALIEHNKKRKLK